jgi:hypothetical protein
VDKLQTTCNGFSDSTGRREFFRRATSLLAGAAVASDFSLEDLLNGGALPGMNSEQPQSDNSPLLINGLPASRLGNTGLEVTKIGCGGMLVNEPNVLLHALDAGMNFVHTAPEYQNGNSMAAFGKVLKEHRRRVIVAVKERPEQLDNILPVLNTDYVDIVIPAIHSASALKDDRLFEAFEAAKRAGKCRYLGFACHSEVTAVLEKAAEMKKFDVAMVSYMNTDDPWFFRSLRLVRDAGMGIVAMRAIPVRTYRNEDLNEEAEIRERYSNILNRWYAHSVMTSMGSYQAVDLFARVLDEGIVWRGSRPATRG